MNPSKRSKFPRQAPARCSLRDMGRYRTTADRLRAWRKANPGKPISEEVRPSIGGKQGKGRDGFGFGTPGYHGDPPSRYRGPRDPSKPNSPTVDHWGYAKADGHGFRSVGYADEIRSIRHKGWYTDPTGDGGTLRGIVVQLPARKGVPQYLAGTEHSDWDIHTLDLGTIYTEKEEAARAADSMAEYAAEHEREYQYGESVKARAVDNRQAIRDSLAESAEIRAALARTSDRTARRVLRERLASELRNRAKLRAEIVKLQDSPSEVLGY